MNARPGHLLMGILQLAMLRSEGIDQFGASPAAFLNSLAPLIAFPLVGGILRLAAGGGLDAVVTLLGAVVALLAPPVLSEVLARLWGREREWLRYATAFNWSRWAMLLALGMSLMFMAFLIAVGLAERTALVLGLLALAAYGVVLDWFVARVGLRLVWWQAALLVVVVNVGAALLFLTPRFLGASAEGQPS
jgi:hypothetical protein